MKKETNYERGNILFLERHFHDEVRYMILCMTHLKPTGQLENLYLVAFLVYIRNFYEFFYIFGKKDRACAQHYIKNWNEIVKRPEGLRSIYEQISRYSLHLSYKRDDKDGYKQYNIPYLYEHFREVIITFLEKLPDKTDILTKLLEDLKKAKLQFV